MQGSNSRTVYPKFSYKHRTHSEGQSGVTNRAQHNTPQQRTNGKGVSMACEPKRCSHSNRGRHHHDFRDHQADKGQEPCQLRKVTNHSSGPRNSKPCCRTVQRTLHTNASLSLNMGEWNAASWCRGVSSAKKKCSKRNSSDKSLHPAKQQRVLLHFWGHEPQSWVRKRGATYVFAVTTGCGLLLERIGPRTAYSCRNLSRIARGVHESACKQHRFETE
jgi:hypothetical protein